MGAISYKSLMIISDYLKNLERTECIEFFAKVEELFPDALRNQLQGEELDLYLQNRLILGKQDHLKKLIEQVLPYLSREAKDRLETNLANDGYLIFKNALYPAGLVEMFNEHLRIRQLISEESRLTQEPVLTYLEKNQEYYTDGQWEASIREARKFVESLLRGIAIIIQNTKQERKISFNNPAQVRKYLYEVGFLEDEDINLIMDGIYGGSTRLRLNPNLPRQNLARNAVSIVLIIGINWIKKTKSI